MKAIHAGVPILATKAVPTDETIRLAREFDLTLICQARPDSAVVYNDPLGGEALGVEKGRPMSAAKRQSARAGVIFALALVVLGGAGRPAHRCAQRCRRRGRLPCLRSDRSSFGCCRWRGFAPMGRIGRSALIFPGAPLGSWRQFAMGVRCLRCFAPAIIVGTALTVLCGGSVGKGRRRRSRWGAAASGLCAIVFPRVSARCWRQRLWAPLSALCWMPRWRASCSPSRRASPKARLACFARCAGGDVFSVLERWYGRWAYAFFGFRCGAGRIGRCPRRRFLHGGSGCRGLCFCSLRWVRRRTAGPCFLRSAREASGRSRPARGARLRWRSGGEGHGARRRLCGSFHYEDVRSYCGTGLCRLRRLWRGEALALWASS